jgi:hypothetical protein
MHVLVCLGYVWDRMISAEGPHRSILTARVAAASGSHDGPED